MTGILLFDWYITFSDVVFRAKLSQDRSRLPSIESDWNIGLFRHREVRVQKELDYDLTENEIVSLSVVMNEAHVARCNIILAAGPISLQRQKELGLLDRKIVSR